MKTNDVDRLLASFFELDAPRQEPEDLLPRVLTITRRRRPSPSWLATLRGAPMTTRTGPLRTSSTRGLAVASLALAVLIAAAVAALVVGSRPAVVPPVSPTAAPSAVTASASATPSSSAVAPSSPSTGTFATTGWTLTYLDGPSWIIGTSTKDMNFENLNAPVVISVGTLESVVRPTSTLVTEPELDRTVKTTVAGYLAWLDKHPKLNVTDPIDVTVGGRPAKQVDVTLKPGENYAQGSIPSRLGIAWFGAETVAIGPTNGETHRMNLIAIGGRTVIVDVASTDPASTFAVADEMVRTFQFADGS